MESEFREYLLKLAEPKAMIAVVTLLLLAFVLYYISKKTTYNTKILTYGALAIALSFVLSYIRIFKMPNGGSITPASMFPILLFALMAGPGAGIAAGLCYGLLQATQEPFIVGIIQFVLDYPLAFAMLGLAGFFRNNMYVGVVVGILGRSVCHIISGIVFFPEFANGQNVFLYSIIYNSSYLLPEMIVCVVIILMPSMKAFAKRSLSTF